MACPDALRGEAMRRREFVNGHSAERQQPGRFRYAHSRPSCGASVSSLDLPKMTRKQMRA